MKSGALIVGTVVSLVLLTVAGTLYVMSSRNDEQPYRTSIDLVRQIQQLSSEWSMEVSRVKSDPLTDFDSLAAFIPRMSRLKERLTETVRIIPDLPERLGNDLDAYIHAVEAKEESIERFKTGYAVVRNSTRYLPLAAVNVAQQARESRDDELTGRVTTLIRDINLYLPTPTETARRRLTTELGKLQEASVAYQPALANALANLLSHAEVLVTRQGSTEELFRRATSNRISELTDQLSGSLQFEIGKKAVLSRYYNMGILAVLGTLALFWVLLGVHQRGRAEAVARPAAASPAFETPTDFAAPPSLPAGQNELTASLPMERSPAPEETPLELAVESSAADHAAPAPEEVFAEVADAEPSLAGAAPTPADRATEALILQGFVAGSIADALSKTADHLAGRMDFLRQTQRRIQDALQNEDGMPSLYDQTEFDNEIDAMSAIASNVRQEADGIADLARRLKSFSNSDTAYQDVDRNMIDINTCIQEAIDATGAESVATIVKSLGDVSEIFALKAEFVLMLIKVIENSVHAVQDLTARKGVIKIDTAQKDNEIQITVIDNGEGIIPERRVNIFKPFYTSRDGAMGIGLALTGHLVKRYEGTIKINSLPGQGTVARITLPAGVPAP